MIPTHATHPGVHILQFIEPLGVSQAQLARHLGISVVRLNEIVKGKRGITAETALLLAQAFGTTPQFWTNLQATWELSREIPTVRPVPMLPELVAFHGKDSEAVREAWRLPTRRLPTRGGR